MKTVEQQFKIGRLREQRDSAKNSYEKRMYSKMLKNVEKGLCPYGCIDYKKQYQEDELYDTSKITKSKERLSAQSA